jgi:hypothetical protein
MNTATTKITTPAQANAAFAHLFDEGEGYGPGLRADGLRMSVEDAEAELLNDSASRFRLDLSDNGIRVVQSTDGSLTGLRDDAGEGAWAIVIEVAP